MPNPNCSPLVGRVVHYVLPDSYAAGECRPALLITVDREQGTAYLHVFVRGSADCGAARGPMFERSKVPYSPDGELGTWHWAEDQG